MLNIISNSIKSKKTRGPKKVLNNLTKGLEQLGYPYVINKELNCCKRLWIHDDPLALEQIKKLPKDTKVLVGPNLFVNPENIPKQIDLSNIIYLQPSQVVKNIWGKRGYKNKIEVWPVGIDTDEYKENNSEKDRVLIYFKNRDESELKKVIDSLDKRNILYNVIRYGSYKDDDYKKTLKVSRYIIWLGVYESQGIALEEALSCNIPIFILDKADPISPFDTEGTSAPYFDDRCGVKIKGFSDFENLLEMFESKYRSYRPRDYVLENLTLKKQAFEFIKLYETHFGYKTEDGLKEKERCCKKYRVSIIKKYLNKIYGKIVNH